MTQTLGGERTQLVPYPYAQASHELAVDGSEGLRVAVWNDGLYSTTLAAFTVPGEDVHTLLRDRGAHNPGYGQMVERLTALTGVGWQPGDGADNAHSILAMFGKDGSVEFYDARRGDVRLYDLRYDATQGGFALTRNKPTVGKDLPVSIASGTGIIYGNARKLWGHERGSVSRGDMPPAHRVYEQLLAAVDASRNSRSGWLRSGLGRRATKGALDRVA